MVVIMFETVFLVLKGLNTVGQDPYQIITVTFSREHLQILNKTIKKPVNSELGST